MCFKIWKMVSEETVNEYKLKSLQALQPLKEKLDCMAGSLRWMEPIFIFLRLLPISFHFFAFPLAKLQENICHGFKRFISFKAEGAGRPNHQ